MNTKNFDEVAASTLAGLQIDLLQKLRKGVITIAQFEKFLNLSPGKRVEFFGSEGEISTFQKSEFFKHRAPGQIQLCLWDTFKNLLTSASETLKVVSIPKYETLTETTYDKDIIAKYGENIIVQSIDDILSEMQAVITSNDKTFADGRATFWYTKYEGRVFYVYCFWNSDNQGWHCDASEVNDGSRWLAGCRMVVPATL